MLRPRLWLTLAFMAQLCALGAHADVYRWVDEKGVEHYSDDPSGIPVRHLERVSPTSRSFHPVIAERELALPAAPAAEPAPVAPDDPARFAFEKRFGGRTELDWRGRYRGIDALSTRYDRCLALPKEHIAEAERVSEANRTTTPHAEVLPASGVARGVRCVIDTEHECGALLAELRSGERRVSEALAGETLPCEVFLDLLGAAGGEVRHRRATLEVEAARAEVPHAWRRARR